MEQRYLIDTNTAIDYLDNKLPNKANDLIEKIDVEISVVTRIELLGWSKALDQKLEILTNFISFSVVHSLNEDVVLKTIELRKNYKIKLPDAIIAATALVYNQTLITNNTNDFKDIIGLKSLNPYKI